LPGENGGFGCFDSDVTRDPGGQPLVPIRSTTTRVSPPKAENNMDSRALFAFHLAASQFAFLSEYGAIAAVWGT
jgi:hypothetical protein